MLHSHRSVQLPRAHHALLCSPSPRRPGHLLARGDRGLVVCIQETVKEGNHGLQHPKSSRQTHPSRGTSGQSRTTANSCIGSRIGSESMAVEKVDADGRCYPSSHRQALRLTSNLMVALHAFFKPIRQSLTLPIPSSSTVRRHKNLFLPGEETWLQDN
jgi:hypothetical protein